MPKLHTVPEDRKQALEGRRRLKMASSAHAYVRGNTIKFYEWLGESSVARSLPSGPPIWICGDCHVGNLGPVAAVSGEVEIEIRDLDQTVIGNPVHDIMRLALSLAMAARSSDLPGVTTARMLEVLLDGYVSSMTGGRAHRAGMEVAPVRKVLRESLSRQWRHLAEERIEDVTPHIPLGSRFWPLKPEERTALEKLFEEEHTRKMVHLLHHEKEERPVKLLDAAYWMKGCSSLGRLRFAVLLGVGRKRERSFRLLDIKEATAAAAPRSDKRAMPGNDAERVVAGACALSPFLGERMLATRLTSRDVVMRELRPQDLKFELNRLTQDEAIATARLLAGVVGRAHARQLSRADRQVWATTLQSRPAKGIDAPSWLWTGVLDLIALHESAYLEHCRRYALAS